MPTPARRRKTRIPSMEANEQLGIDADLKVTARNPETGEEEVIVDTEEGIEPEDADIDIEVIKEQTNNDDQRN
jgi:hypothetical protein